MNKRLEKAPKTPDTMPAAQAIVRLETIKISIDELVKLKREADLAAVDYKEAVDKVAVDAGVAAPILKRFVNARAGEKFSKRRKEVEQLSLLFEEVGE